MVNPRSTALGYRLSLLAEPTGGDWQFSFGWHRACSEGWLHAEIPALAGTEPSADRQPEGCTPTRGATGYASAVLDVAARVFECGVRSLILLDLAGVGEGRGVPTLELCRSVRELSPDVEIITGGGVRDAADLEALDRAGVDGVLIASALHDGSLTPEVCSRWRG